MHQLAAVVTNELVIKQADEPDIDIVNLPWQDIKPTMLHMVARMRQVEVARTRIALAEIREIDDYVTQKALKLAPPEDQPILRCITTLSKWDDILLQYINYHGDEGRCSLCGRADGDGNI